jgi:hypothetical protein
MGVFGMFRMEWIAVLFTFQANERGLFMTKNLESVEFNGLIDLKKV